MIKRHQARFVLVLLTIILVPLSLFAGETGKITGTVIDEENGNPLPGVNVVLEGTSFGAATDLNGDFVVLFVPPGLYNVKFTFIGYATVTIENVRATKDLTTNLYSVKMGTEAIEGHAVTVIAEKPLIEINATNEVRVVRSEDIQNMSVRGYKDIVSLQTGVVNTGGDLHVRGGRSDEVGYYIDGVYVNNPYSSFSAAGTATGGVSATPDRGTMEIPNTAMEEISFQAGGFNAEYGSANSGIINTTTKEGRDRFHSSFETLTDAMWQKDDGGDPMVYSYGNQLLSGAISGPVPGLAWVKYFLSGETRAIADAHPTWGTHAVYVGDLDKNLGIPTNGEAFTDLNGNGVWDRESTIASRGRGPVTAAEPYVDENGNGRHDAFFINGNDIKYRNGPLPNNDSKRTMVSGNILFDLKEIVGLPFKLKTGGTYYSDRRDAYIHGRSVFDYYNDNGTLRLRFPREDSKTQTTYARLTGALSTNTYFSFQYSRYEDYYEEYDPMYKKGNGKFLFDDGSASEELPYVQYGKRYDYVDSSWVNPLFPTAGTQPVLTDSVVQYSFAGRVYDEYVKNKIIYNGFKGTVTKQMGKHELKAGFDYRDYNIRFYRIAAPIRLASTFQNNAPYSLAQKDSLLFLAISAIPGEDSIQFNGNWYDKWAKWDTNQDSSISDSEYEAYYDDRIYNTYEGAYAENIGYDVTGTKNLNSGDNGARKPVIGALFVQDKLELKDMILNAGLRYDYIDPNNYRFNPATGGANNVVINTFGNLAETVYLDEEGEYRSVTPTAIDSVGKPLRIKSKIRTLLSPRIGLAFPVTDRTVFHAQYGKFIQQPELNRMFISYTRFLANMQQGNYTTSSNPDLQPVETTQYEIGFKQLVTNDVSLDMTVFYKQMTGYVQIRNVNQVGGNEAAYPTVYALYVNGDYGTVKGLSLALNVRRINRVQLSANYTLQYAGGTGSNSTRQYTIAWQSGNYPTFVSPLEFDQRHTANIVIDYRMGEKDIIPMFGINLLAEYGSGRRYTPSRVRSEVFDTSNPAQPVAGLNSGVMPSSFSLNLQIDKGFRINNVYLAAYAQITNLLNTEIVNDVYAATGEPGNDNWLASSEGQAIWLNPYGSNIGSDLYKSFISHPYNWGPPRQVKLGLRVEF